MSDPNPQSKHAARPLSPRPRPAHLEPVPVKVLPKLPESPATATAPGVRYNPSLFLAFDAVLAAVAIAFSLLFLNQL